MPDANVGTGSCGDTGSGPLVTYCSWEDSGSTAPQIGDNSCTVVDSCTNLGEGATIGANSCTHENACAATGQSGSHVTIHDNACLGSSACQAGGDGGGTLIVHDGSCSGTNACEGAGAVGGYAEIGADSCIGTSACDSAGQAAFFRVGQHSCLGETACAFAGSAADATASATIGNFSCVGGGACEGVGVDGSSTIGNYSCVGGGACENVGAFGSSTTGNYSCNTSSANGDTQDCRADYTTIGDCEFNTPEIEKCTTTIEVRKFLYPSYDAGRFYLPVEGESEVGPVGHNGTTGPVQVEPGGPYTVSESAATGTSLGNYRTTAVCQDQDRTLVASGYTTSLQFSLGEHDHVTCTFLNQRIWSWFWWRLAEPPALSRRLRAEALTLR